MCFVGCSLVRCASYSHQPCDRSLWPYRAGLTGLVKPAPDACAAFLSSAVAVRFSGQRLYALLGLRRSASTMRHLA